MAMVTVTVSQSIHYFQIQASTSGPQLTLIVEEGSTSGELGVLVNAQRESIPLNGAVHH